MTSSTLKTLLEDFLREWQLGEVGLTTAAGSSTTVVDATRLAGPRGSGWIPRLSSVRITSGARVGEKGKVTVYDPDTGTLTLHTALTGAPGSGVGFLVVRPDVCDDIDRMIEALGRGLRDWCRRWGRVPVTAVPDGDLEGTTVTDWWTGSNATPTYAELAVPHVAGRRVLNIESTGIGASVSSNAIPVHEDEVWDFYTTLRHVSGNDSPSFVLRDVTNSADMDPTFEAGGSVRDENVFDVLKGSVQIPAGCREMKTMVRQAFSGSVAQMGPVVMRPRGTRRAMFQPHLQTSARIGKYYKLGAKVDLHSHAYEGAYEEVELGVHYDEKGWGIEVNFDQEPPFPLFYDELFVYAPLTSDAQATQCPAELARAAMAYEFFKSADAAERRKDGKASRWGPDVGTAWAMLQRQRKAWGAERRFSTQQEYTGVASA